MPNDHSRVRALRKLEELIGVEEAHAIMESVPPFDWHQLATKADLAAATGNLATKDELRVLAAELRTEIGGLRTELHQSLAAQTKWFVTTNAAMVGLALAAAKLMF
ncbi:MAG TPA: hypothetical protein VNQ73_10290 [Ilumatobacter sp.]|nr:hypothetical protein [Ilumatobacter sp.]